MACVKPKASRLILLAILAVAAFLRLWRLDFADVLTDEASLGIRSLGYVDFLGTQAQGTPAEWYDVRPWWSYLSFHDHPPLVFWLQHLSFRMLGENTWALRLPSAIAGVAVVYLLYRIGRQLRGETAGLMAAALAAVSLYLIWPSRLGLQESVTLVLLLTTFSLFLAAIERPRLWFAVWTVYGLAILTKYTVMVFLPIALCYLLLFHRKVFRHKLFWISQGLQGLVTLPLTIYNLALFFDRKHFDLQLSTLLRIDVPEWRYLPGKNIGTLAERAAQFWPMLSHTATPLLISATAVGVAVLLVQLRRPQAAFVLLGIGWTSALLLLIGPSPRFLVMLAPWLLLAAALVIADLAERWVPWGRLTAALLLAALVGYGAWYSWVNTFTQRYRGGNVWTYSLLRRESARFGFQELDAVLAREVDAFRPAEPATVQYPVLQGYIDRGWQHDRGKPVKSLAIAFDADLAWPTPLWYFTRRTLYHGWTAVSTDGLKTALNAQQLDAILPREPKAQVLLVVGQNTDERHVRTESAEWFVEQLELTSSTPTAVVGPPERPAFTLWTVPAEKFFAIVPNLKE